jgi:hypothetical protein
MLQPDLKRALLKTRRTERTVASMISNNRVAITILRDTVTHPQKAQCQTIPDMVPAADECRSIADKIDKCVRSEAISDDEFGSLVGRVTRNRAKLLAVFAEIPTIFGGSGDDLR